MKLAPKKSFREEEEEDPNVSETLSGIPYLPPSWSAQKRQKVNQRRHTWVPTTKKEWASKNGGCGMRGIIFGDSLATRLYFRFCTGSNVWERWCCSQFAISGMFPIAPPFRNSDEKSKNQRFFFSRAAKLAKSRLLNPHKKFPPASFSSGSRNIRSLRLGCFMALQASRKNALFPTPTSPPPPLLLPFSISSSHREKYGICRKIFFRFFTIYV